jgi:hypothetical protein
MTDIDTSLVEQVLDIPQRQRKPNVEHYRQSDDLGRRLEVAKRAAFGHAETLGWPPARLKPVFSDNAFWAANRLRSRLSLENSANNRSKDPLGPDHSTIDFKQGRASNMQIEYHGRLRH